MSTATVTPRQRLRQEVLRREIERRDADIAQHNRRMEEDPEYAECRYTASFPNEPTENGELRAGIGFSLGSVPLGVVGEIVRSKRVAAGIADVGHSFALSYRGHRWTARCVAVRTVLGAVYCPDDAVRITEVWRYSLAEDQTANLASQNATTRADSA